MKAVKAREAIETIANERGEIMWGGRTTGRKEPLKRPVRAIIAQASKDLFTVTFGGNRKVESLRGASKFFAAPVASGEVAQDQGEAQAPAAPVKLPGKPPANFVDLARTGNTPQARAYWHRRCQEWAEYKG